MVLEESIFPDLFTAASERWIKQKAIQTPGRKAEKTSGNQMILIDKSKILAK